MEVKEYSLKLSTEQAQKNVEDLNENLKIQEELLFDLEKEIRGYEKQLKKTSKTDLAARKAINDKIAQTKEKLNDERFGLKELNKERKKANEELKINLLNEMPQEFVEYKWSTYWHSLASVVPFKKDVYRNVLSEFLPKYIQLHND